MAEEWVRQYVLNAVADDYENLEQIVGSVIHWAFSDGKVVPLTQIMEALIEIVTKGDAKAYVLSPQPPYSTEFHWSTSEEQFEASRVWELWYHITEQGKKAISD